MKIQEYVTELKKLAKKYPNADVVYTSDDDTFQKVGYLPAAGHFDANASHFTYESVLTEETAELNAICIN